MSRPRRGRTVPATAVMATVVALLASGCGSGHPDAVAARAPVVPGQTTQGPDLSGVQLPNFVMPLVKGSVSRPNPKLTPGAVTTTNANTVCNMNSHAAAPPISAAVQAAVYDAYGLTSPTEQRKYILNLLVPYNLGGASLKANIWPAKVSGTGFYQKIQADHILRQLVCRRVLTLAQAQHALETNWYSAWLRWVVATGHI